MESRHPESCLTFELRPNGGMIELTLLHLPVLERFEQRNQMGWHTLLDILGASIRCEPILARQTYMQRNAARYGVDLDDLQRRDVTGDVPATEAVSAAPGVQPPDQAAAGQDQAGPVDRPLDVAGHEAARQQVQALENPDAANDQHRPAEYGRQHAEERHHRRYPALILGAWSRARALRRAARLFD
jgi:hypothetical protein